MMFKPPDKRAKILNNKWHQVKEEAIEVFQAAAMTDTAEMLRFRGLDNSLLSKGDKADKYFKKKKYKKASEMYREVIKDTKNKVWDSVFQHMLEVQAQRLKKYADNPEIQAYILSKGFDVSKMKELAANYASASREAQKAFKEGYLYRAYKLYREALGNYHDFNAAYQAYQGAR
ncbi:hypothetical protein KY320_03285 [Candidatus Woesearchaeota archaeon]|nr:hypothetical protein [Candidatus Woesearchaeota archaeon]